MKYELYHHGIKGMKWGVRKDKRYVTSDTIRRSVRRHGGPGIYIGTPKRQLAGAKKDLDVLDKGGHLNIGLTKKRQAAYDARDRAALERKIANAERKIADKRVTEIKGDRTVNAGRIAGIAAVTTLAAYSIYKVGLDHGTTQAHNDTTAALTKMFVANPNLKTAMVDTMKTIMK